MNHTPTRTTTPRPQLGHLYSGVCSCGLTYPPTRDRDEREEAIDRHARSVAHLERYWAEMAEESRVTRERNRKQRRTTTTTNRRTKDIA